jgi:hypothetical protein
MEKEQAIARMGERQYYAAKGREALKDKDKSADSYFTIAAIEAKRRETKKKTERLQAYLDYKHLME